MKIEMIFVGPPRFGNIKFPSSGEEGNKNKTHIIGPINIANLK
jgi:hypothetical protein